MEKKRLYLLLEKFGLNEKEIEVYLEAIKHQETTPYILAKKTKIPRTTIYDICLDLSLKGLITIKRPGVYEKQQTIIIPQNPNCIREILRAKGREIRSLEVEILDVVAHLKGEYFTGEVKQNVFVETAIGYGDFLKFYETANLENPAVPTIAWDSWLPIDSHGEQVFNSQLDEDLDRKMKNPSNYREIISVGERQKLSIAYQYRRNPKYFEVFENRYIENSSFALKNRIFVRDKHVYIFSNENDEIYGIKIMSENLAKSLTSIFELQWIMAKPITVELIEKWEEERGETIFVKSQVRTAKKNSK